MFSKKLASKINLSKLVIGAVYSTKNRTVNIERSSRQNPDCLGSGHSFFNTHLCKCII